MQDNPKKLQISEILKKLSSSSEDDRQNGLREAADCADINMLEAVKNLLNDQNPAVRYYAKKAFETISSQISKRSITIAGARNSGETPEAYDEIKSGSAVQDFITSAAREKIKAIQKLPDEKDDIQADILISELESTEDKYVIATIIKKLGKIGDSLCEKYIIPFLSHDDSRVIANAVEALDELNSENGISEMLKLLSHEDNRIKGNITKALYKYLEKDNVSKSLILDKLKSMINSREPWTQDSAIFALKSIGNSHALEILECFNGSGDDAMKEKITAVALDLKRKLTEPSNRQDKKTFAAPCAATKEAELRAIETNKIFADNARHDFSDTIKEKIARRLKSLRQHPENVFHKIMTFLAGLLIFFSAVVIFNIFHILFFYSPGHPEAITGGVKQISDDTIEKAVLGFTASEKFDSALETLRAYSGATYDKKRINALFDTLYLKKIEKYSSDERFEDALGVTAAWKSDNASSTLACILKGQIELKQFNRVFEAKKAFEDALQLDPGNQDAMTGLGECAYQEASFKKSLEYYNRALERQKNDKNDASKHNVYFLIGNSKAAAGDYNGAVSAYRECINSKPDFYICYIGLARSLRSLKRGGEALDAIEKALGYDSGMARAQFECAEISRELSRTGDALRHYKLAMAAEPDNSNYKMAFINFMFSQRIYQGLDELIKSEINAGRQTKELYERLATVQYALGYEENAKKNLEKAISLFGESAFSCHYMAKIAEKKLRPDEAIEYYKKAIRIDNKHLPSYLNISNIYLNVKKDYNQLDSIVETGITNCGGIPALLYNKALGKYYDKKPADALLLLRTVLSSNERDLVLKAKKLEADIVNNAR